MFYISNQIYKKINKNSLIIKLPGIIEATNGYHKSTFTILYIWNKLICASSSCYTISWPIEVHSLSVDLLLDDIINVTLFQILLSDINNLIDLKITIMEATLVSIIIKIIALNYILTILIDILNYVHHIVGKPTVGIYLLHIFFYKKKWRTLIDQ